MPEYFSANISSLLDRIGKAVVIRNYTNTGDKFNPVRTAVDSDAIGASFSYDVSEVDGTAVKRGDREFFLSSAVEVLPTSKIIDTEEYSIISIDRVEASDGIAVYIAQGRS